MNASRSSPAERTRFDMMSVDRTLTSMSREAFRQARAGQVRFTFVLICHIVFIDVPSLRLHQAKELFNFLRSKIISR